MKNIWALIKLFSSKEKRNLGILTGAIIIMAFMEVVGIGAIGPFMTVAADPTIVQTNQLLNTLYQVSGIGDVRYFIALLGGIFFLIILGTNGLTTIVMYWMFHWSNMRSYSLGRRLISQYLYQPYSYFLNHNTSELSKNILSEVQQVVNQAIRPGMELLARSMVAIAILLFLVISNPLVAGIVLFVLGGSYALVFGTMRKRLSFIGARLREYNAARFKAAGEAFGAIKDVKLLGKEAVFEGMFSRAARKQSQYNAKRQVMTGLPHYIIEAIALGLVVVLIVMMILRGGNLTEIIPIMSIYVFAGYRLMPAMRVVFKNIGALRSAGPIVKAMVEDLTFGAKEVEEARKRATQLLKEKKRLPFKQNIELKNITFSYSESLSPVIENLSITIPRLSTIGFIGPTGCGKTTLIDIILGLLEPSAGAIQVDGATISSENLRNWQLNFGYVPQHIFLADDSVRKNIAFGVENDQIDNDAVVQAAKIAHLDEFVTKEMPHGYETIVGERGIRLSGGQRQRIGIARALYYDPDIIVMDEATSALDNLTEAAVMDAINELMGNKTILLIAHRLSTVQKADTIFMLDKGKIAATGSYEELLKSNRQFQRLASGKI